MALKIQALSCAIGKSAMARERPSDIKKMRYPLPRYSLVCLASLALLPTLFGCGTEVTVIQARLVERSIPAPQAIGRSEESDSETARLYSSALAALTSGDTLASVHELHEILLQDSAYWAAYYHLGLIDSPFDEPSCIDHFRSALRFAPPHDSVRCLIYVAMGACYEKQTALGFAEQNYRTALQLDPLSEPARMGLERVLSMRQDD